MNKQVTISFSLTSLQSILRRNLNIKSKILIIDDDENIRSTLSAILRKEGYITDTAETGKEAIEKTLNNFYNLALIDIVLPDMKGTELLVKMRDTRPKMRKIIITGHASLENAVDSLNLGAHAYIIKPLNIGNLLKIVEENLEEQQEEVELTQEKVAEYIESRARQLEEEK